MSTKQPPHVHLYTEFSRRIRSGRWETGARVPSERALLAEFGVSRAPLRQALALLRAEGTIVGGRGAPPRVRRAAPEQRLSVFQPFTEWAHEAGFTPGHQLVEIAHRPASEDVARELRVRPEATIVEVVRLRLLDDEPALFERSYFPSRIGGALLAQDFEGASVYRSLARAGVVPAAARHSIDAVAAHPLDAEWLRVSPGFPLLRTRRVSSTGEGATIEYADSRYLPSMTTFAVDSSAPSRRR